MWLKLLCSRQSRNAKGITLVELLVAVAVSSIVAAFAIPNLQLLVANNRQTSVINRFVTSVLLARSIAITRNIPATICPSIDGERCHDNNDWSHGWIVVQGDVSGDDPLTNGMTKIVHVEQGTSTVQMNANRALFTFRPRGGRATNGTVLFCIPDASMPKAVIVSYNGRPRTSRVLPNGGDIECEVVTP